MHRFIYLIFLLIITYGIYNSLFKDRANKREHSNSLVKKGDVYKSKKEYIIHVINYGSHQFNFKGGVMEGGYIPKEDANKVACYVMSLSGESCSYDDEAKAIFSSSCAGCHGVDGKGLNGLYPDLSKKRLLGLKASDD